MKKIISMCLFLIAINAFGFHHFGLNLRTGSLNHLTYTRALLKCFGEDSVASWRNRLKIKPSSSWTHVRIDSLGNIVCIQISKLPIEKDTLYNFMNRNHLVWSAYTDALSISKSFNVTDPLRVDKKWLDSGGFKYPRQTQDGTLRPTFPKPFYNRIFENDLSHYSDSTWFKPVLKDISHSDNDNIDHLYNLSLFELSLFYSLGEYELAQLINKREISAEILLNSDNVPESVRIINIADDNIRTLLTERLLNFWNIIT